MGKVRRLEAHQQQYTGITSLMKHRWFPRTADVRKGKKPVLSSRRNVDHSKSSNKDVKVNQVESAAEISFNKNY